MDLYSPTPFTTKKKGMSGCLKFFLVCLVLLALIAGAAAVTNPSKEKHQKELSGIISQAVKETIKSKNTTGLELDAIYDKVVPKILENVSDELLEYHNYGLFSI